MNELYSIKSETLTGICDVLRSELGETRVEITSIPFATYADANAASGYTVISIPGATTIHVEFTYSCTAILGNGGFYQIAPGELSSMPADAIKLQSTTKVTEHLTFENADAITIFNSKGAGFFSINSANATIYGTDADGNYVDFEGASYIEQEAEVKNTFQSDEIAPGIQDIVTAKQVKIDEKQEEIDANQITIAEQQALIEELRNMSGDIPEEALTITGDCSYRFACGGWDWFIDKYGAAVTTKDITKTCCMFWYSNAITIPFEINCEANTVIDAHEMFSGCNELTAVPKINNCKIGTTTSIFSSCHKLREIPEDIGDWFDWSTADGATSAYSYNNSAPFFCCYSLRKISMSFLEHGNPVAAAVYAIYYNLFTNCYTLDEIVDLPNPHLSATWTSNAFYYTFNTCDRLKNLTFKMPNGAPYVVNWKSQTIDLSNNVGYTNSSSYITGYNSGITADKEVTDDASYQALKDDPDWFTLDVAYSRYNHDSAVATINSLPDTSAYLATAGGTNTIKFKGAAGSATDGGAINTLTDAEIAVAAARGWTVTLV